MFMAAIAEVRYALAPSRRKLPFAQLRLIVLLGLAILALPQFVRAQHCGRIGYVVSAESESLSWEQGDAGFGQLSASETSRIRNTGCEGPLCRSRTPQPFAPGNHADAAAMPFPWKCTALTSLYPDLDPVAGANAYLSSFFENPFIEPSPEPPRIG